MKIFVLLISSISLLATSLSGQIDAQFRRDSIEIEKGIPGSTDFEPFFKIINEEFDENNRPLTSVVYNIESPSQPVPFQRQSFEYENGNTTSFLLEEWDEVQENWIPVKQEISTYEDNRILGMLRKRESNGVLLDHRRWTYAYNTDGMETGRLLQDWNVSMGTWDNLSRKTISYTAEGKIEVQLLEKYLNNEWENKRRRVWTWMAGDLQPSRTLTQQWSSSDQEWVNISRKTYSMGTNGLWSGAVLEEWDTNNNEWVNEVREVLGFNPGDNSSIANLERWDTTNWQPSLRGIYEQSANQNTALLQQWNAPEMQHENFLRYGATLNADKLPSQNLGMQRWNVELESWENRDYTRRISYFWTDTNATPTNEVVPQSHCIIPNPYANGNEIFCTIPIHKFPLSLEVHNLYGQIVYSRQISNQQVWLNTNLNPGLYIIKIQDNREIYHLEKIVVAK